MEKQAVGLKELMTARHSSNKFEKGVEFTESHMKEVYDYVKSAPSAYNLQHTEFLVITDETLKGYMKELHFNQYKIGVASALIVVMANRYPEKNFESVYVPQKQLGILTEDDYNNFKQLVDVYVGSIQKEESRTKEVVTNASVVVGFTILALQDCGWGSCIMHLHNWETVQETFGISNNYEPICLIAVGKTEGAQRHRGFRRMFSDSVSFNKFGK